jgi:predicted glycoside hydrolase/deacetylase ChbG (UPF0249 family)
MSSEVLSPVDSSLGSSTRRLIVNADDFGQSLGINLGVIRAHEDGIVTSASLMVRWPSARTAAEYARAHPELSLGLHFDLGEWSYREGRWTARYEVAATDDPVAVERELAGQLAKFRRLLGRSPTHLDSHQHVHRSEPIRTILLQLADALRIPLRGVSPRVRYCGDFYGQTGRGRPLPEAITIEALLGIIARLPPGISELGCHPGDGEDADSMYRAEREREVEVLSDPRVRSAIVSGGIRLCSFSDVPNMKG